LPDLDEEVSLGLLREEGPDLVKEGLLELDEAPSLEIDDLTGRAVVSSTEGVTFESNLLKRSEVVVYLACAVAEDSVDARVSEARVSTPGAEKGEKGSGSSFTVAGFDCVSGSTGSGCVRDVKSAVVMG